MPSPSSLIFRRPPPLLRHHILHRLTVLRRMAGGPRTFPGGLNKWQWKRLHEKQARLKEQRLLDHEKQLYHARLRSEIRSKIAGSDPVPNSPNYKPLSPKEHIKALADRFVKAGAEDLWNEDDGPVHPVRCSKGSKRVTGIESDHVPIDLRKVISGQSQSQRKSQRQYSVMAGIRNDQVSYNRIEMNRNLVDLRNVMFGQSQSQRKSQRHYSVMAGIRSDQVSYNRIEVNRNLVDLSNVMFGQSQSYLHDSVITGNEVSYKRCELNHKPVDLRKVMFGQSQSQRDYSVMSSITSNRVSCNRIGSNYNAVDLRKVMFGQSQRCYSVMTGVRSNPVCYNKLLNVSYYSVRASAEDLRKLISGQSHRFYSVRYRKNDSSSSEDETDVDEGFLVERRKDVSLRGARARMAQLSLSRLSDGEGSGGDDEGEGGGKKVMMSSAALGKYDVKRTKRIRLEMVEDEDDLSLHVQAIRNEFNKRRLAEKDGETGGDDSILSPKRFDECNISPLTVQALTLAGYVQMTKVQDATIAACLEGKDVLVKAKTGTGKSAAFLLPAIETVLKASTNNTAKRVPPICVLVLCPTRELASQITAEANVLLKYHDGIGVQTLVGGTRFKDDQKRLETEPCHIIVATPGRLIDHIENKSGFSARLMGLKMLILDEADHLLDLGFRKDMEKIVDCLPRKRQSLLFSATLPKEVRRVSQLVLQREHAYINTVGLGPETHDKVNQSYLIAPHEQHFQIVHHLLKDHIFQVPNYKVIVFCTTAMMTSLVFSLLREMKMNVREIHSRKPQLYRTRVSEEFKEEKQLILITSDVSARGMNYPDVSLVLQVGVPVDREQYINRLGRTGREGKGGEGILLLAPWEEHFLEEIKDLPLHKSPPPHLDPDTKIKIETSMAKVDPSVKEAAYHAWLGYYNSIRETGRDKTTLVELAKGFSDTIGLEKVPALFRKTVIKMGLKDIPGIRVRK